jgi:hypothetical protein
VEAERDVRVSRRRKTPPGAMSDRAGCCHGANGAG